MVADRSRPARRSSWVRSLPSLDLHAIAGRFDRDRQTVDLTPQQEWLYDQCVTELERRHRSRARLLERCWCRYCVAPFPDLED